jgi:uncharacterized protein YgiM (DUF1202 family)
MEKSAQQEIKERDNPSVSSNQEDGKQRTSKPPLQVTANVGSNQDDSKRITPKDMTNDNLPVRYLIVTKKTNIRAEDKTKSKIITTPKLGERVEKLDASDKWFKVRTAEGKSGWIIKSAVIQAE